MRLLPGQEVLFVAFDGDGHRFVRLFRRTWARLPLGSRRRICRHWRREDLRRLGCYEARVELIESCRALWPDEDEGPLNYASVTQCGFALYFNAEAFDAMPDNVACDVIAHELAHVIQWSQVPAGEEAAHIRAYKECPFDVEFDADELITWWGFDPNSVDEWSRETGRTSVIQLEDTPENRLLVIEGMLRRGR